MQSPLTGRCATPCPLGKARRQGISAGPLQGAAGATKSSSRLLGPTSWMPSSSGMASTPARVFCVGTKNQVPWTHRLSRLRGRYFRKFMPCGITQRGKRPAEGWREGFQNESEASQVKARLKPLGLVRRNVEASLSWCSATLPLRIAGVTGCGSPTVKAAVAQLAQRAQRRTFRHCPR